MGAVRTGAGRLSLTPMPAIHVVALAVASFACAFDLRTRRIPNWLTFGAAVVALVFHVVTGGPSGLAQSIARELIPAIKFSDLPSVMDRLFEAYSKHSSPQESFLEFSRRHDIATLKSFCAPQEVVQP